MNALENIETAPANTPRGRYGETVQRVITTMRQFTTASEVLRMLGALAMVASISVFVLQGWADGNDVQRYFKLLAQTGLLAAGGLLLSYALNDNKGARLLFGLGLVAVPANFAILGALFYSVASLDAGVMNYPTYALWAAPDPAMIGWVTGAAVAALLPVMYLAFNIFSRPNAARLTIGFTALNGLMLLPMRSAGMTGMLAAAAVFGALFVLRSLDTDHAATRTPGARFAALMLATPAFVIVGRGLFLYQFDEMFGLTLSIAGYLGLRQVALRLAAGKSPRGLLELVSVPMSWAVAWYGSALFAELFRRPAAVGEEWLMVIFAAVVAIGMLDIVGRTTSNAVRKSTLRFSSLLINLAMLLNVLLIDNALATALAVVACGALSVYGYKMNCRFVFATGTLTAVLCAVIGMREVVDLLLESGWLGLGIAGAVAIIFASLLERHGAAIRLKLRGANGLFARRQTSD